MYKSLTIADNLTMASTINAQFSAAGWANESVNTNAIIRVRQSEKWYVASMNLRVMWRGLSSKLRHTSNHSESVRKLRCCLRT